MCNNCECDTWEYPGLVINWHEVVLHDREILSDRDGQTKLIRDGSSSLQEAAKEKRESISLRKPMPKNYRKNLTQKRGSLNGSANTKKRHGLKTEN